MNKPILFYKTNEPYGCFSNFSKHGFSIDGIYWSTSEHYFQAQKFHDKKIQNIIREQLSPMKAAEMGRNRVFSLRNDWELVKDDVMRLAVFEKFRQNEVIRNILLSTKDAILIEHTYNDRYWADGGDGTGNNMLGIILMETRKLLEE